MWRTSTQVMKTVASGCWWRQYWVERMLYEVDGSPVRRDTCRDAHVFQCQVHIVTDMFPMTRDCLADSFINLVYRRTTCSGRNRYKLVETAVIMPVGCGYDNNQTHSAATVNLTTMCCEHRRGRVSRGQVSCRKCWNNEVTLWHWQKK